MMPLSWPVVLIGGAVVLLLVGIFGLILSRNMLKLVIALQIMVKAALLALLAAGSAGGRLGLAQSIAVTVIVADTMIAVIGLALAVRVHTRLKTLDVDQIAELKG